MCTWDRARLVSMMVAAASVARDGMILPKLEEYLLFLVLPVCNLAFNGLLCIFQGCHRGLAEPCPECVGREIHVAQGLRAQVDTNEVKCCFCVWVNCVL